MSKNLEVNKKKKTPPKGVQKRTAKKIEQSREKTTRVSTTKKMKKKKLSKKAVLPPSPWKKRIAIVFDVAFYGLMLAIVLGATLFVLNKDPEKSFWGYRFYTVKTNSMVPKKDSLPGGFYAGDIIIVKSATYDQVNVNDIITYRVGEDANLTHRLVKKADQLEGKEGQFVITKGDANNSDDPPISAERIVGKTLFVIPKVGEVLKFVQGHFVVSLVFLFSLFGFIWVLRVFADQPTIVTKKRSVRQRR
ncbi:hypothetical protein ATZ33_08770 [Enterococcus silesiacus]|uniref:Signal peptidase I n=1 Tax=Enterococcus silesiacus TaxID=332949 RepID=A0ABM5W9I2_9ENTE|nr:signal peptidase I [Enterococcus silesiacus]ALS01455.1 hypothetical protein ATZ33_08770 [Enterococcus silesiacus]